MGQAADGVWNVYGIKGNNNFIMLYLTIHNYRSESLLIIYYQRFGGPTILPWTESSKYIEIIQVP